MPQMEIIPHIDRIGFKYFIPPIRFWGSIQNTVQGNFFLIKCNFTLVERIGKFGPAEGQEYADQYDNNQENKSTELNDGFRLSGKIQEGNIKKYSTVKNNT